MPAFFFFNRAAEAVFHTPSKNSSIVGKGRRITLAFSVSRVFGAPLALSHRCSDVMPLRTSRGLMGDQEMIGGQMRRLILYVVFTGLLAGTCFAQRGGSHASTPGASVNTMGPPARTMAPDARLSAPNVGVKAAPNAKTVDPNAAAATDARTVNPNAKTAPNAKATAPDARKVPADAGVSTAPDARQN